MIDTETTGLDEAEGRIVELAIVVAEAGKVVAVHHWMLNPGMPIPEAATAVHGIRDQDVARAPSFADVAVEVATALEGALPAAYNASFDRRFVEAEWARTGLSVRPPALDPATRWIDPYVWARLIQRYERGKKRLGDVAGRLGLSAAESHRATADAELALKVLFALARDRRVPATYGELLDRQAVVAEEQEADFQRWLATRPARAAQ
jgi:DNA polymerase-3 subunit epsilon